MKRAFTLVELLVVLGMIAVLMAAMGSSLGQARKRAKIAKATQEAREITNAILAYENYAPKIGFANLVGEYDAEEGGRLSAIRGRGQADDGSDVPVLYNGPLVDPWGRPYKIMVKRAGNIASRNESEFITAPSLPNLYRLTDEEKGWE